MSRLNRKRISVLWIEDGTTVEIPHLTTPLIVEGRYDLAIAKDASEGIRYLTQPGGQFDVVIFDLYLAPGDDEGLIERYQARPQGSGSKTPIGMSILIDLFSSGREEHPKVIRRPEWLTPDRVGLLTVEPLSNVLETMHKLGIDEKAFRQKGATMPDATLKDLIDYVYARRQPGSDFGGEK